MRIVLIMLLLLCINRSNAQEYKKDSRSKLAKENGSEEFQTDIINNADILKALDISGVNLLTENEQETNTLLKSSPHYYVVSYKVNE